MEKEIDLTLEVYLKGDSLSLKDIKNKKEVTIKKPFLFATINKTPYFKMKLQNTDNISVFKVVKIFNVKEMEDLKILLGE